MAPVPDNEQLRTRSIGRLCSLNGSVYARLDRVFAWEMVVLGAIAVVV